MHRVDYYLILNLAAHYLIMPANSNRQFLDFEKPVQELSEELEKVKKSAEKTKVDMSAAITELENKIQEKRKEIYSKLTPWQRVQVSRHPDRPYTLAYIDAITNNTFLELHG